MEWGKNECRRLCVCVVHSTVIVMLKAYKTSVLSAKHSWNHGLNCHTVNVFVIYRDRAHLSPAHTGRENNPWLSIDSYYVMVPLVTLCLLANNRKMSKSCYVLGCTANKLKKPELIFYKLLNQQKKSLTRQKWR